MKIVLFLFGFVLLLGFTHSVLAINGGVTLTSPMMVTITGQQISEFHPSQQIGIESKLTNTGISEQKFAYLVQVTGSTGKTDFLEGFSASMLPNQSFTASQVWTPKDVGQYTVRVFVWDSLTSATPLTDVHETKILVN